MARKYFTHVREEKALEFKLVVPKLEEYKEAWLVIYNNVKVSQSTLYKLSNDYESGIYLMCNPKYKSQVESFLSQFGEIEYCKEKMAVFVDVECDYDNFDKDYVYSEYVFGELD